MELSSAEPLPDLLGKFEKYVECVGGQMCERSVGILTDFG